jgi:hypothetical protein
MNRFTFLATLLVALLTTSTASAQDAFVGVATIESTNSGAIIYGDTTLATDSLVTLRLEDSLGHFAETIALISPDGSMVASIDGGAGINGFTLVTASSSFTGSILGSGLLLVDTDDLGDDWVPLVMPESPHEWPPGGSCSDMADDIHTTLGGTAEIHSLQSMHNPEGTVNVHPLGGTYRGHPTGWRFHDVVVKDGMVYDGFGPSGGTPIDEWKELWTNKDNIAFPF